MNQLRWRSGQIQIKLASLRTRKQTVGMDKHLRRFQLTVFTATAIQMVRQAFLVYLLKYMFHITLNLISLLDLSILRFMTAIAYVTRMILERYFDVEPIDEE